MQGVEGPDRELWDAGQVVGHLVAEGSMFAFLAEHRALLFPDEQYADLFSTIGSSVVAGDPDGGGVDVAGVARAVGSGVRRGGPL